MQNLAAAFAELEQMNLAIMYTLTELNVPIRSKVWTRISLCIDYTDKPQVAELQADRIQNLISNELRSIWDQIDELPNQKSSSLALNISLQSLHYLASSNSENLGKQG